jgi:NhaA family Na+:H+ antiporter
MAGTDRPGDEPRLPRAPIDRIVRPINRFLHVEAAGGIVLLTCTVVALVLANSRFGEEYLAIWATKVGIKIGSFEMVHSVKHWINDGLMAVFFFVVGLEVKREMVLGELRDIRRAALPIAAALGGMIVPAGIYLAFQWGEPGARGWGIPMATDIAFVVGCMALLGPRIPHILRVMVLSLAIVDDIGAIVVIAVGYTESLDGTWLFLGFVGIVVVRIMAHLGVRSFGAYTIVGAFVWLAFHESGVHATIAGVILGLLTPAKSWVSTGLFGRFLTSASDVVHGGSFNQLSNRAQEVRNFLRAARESVSPLEYLEAALHPWSSFVIMPIFALANAGVVFHVSDLGDPIAMAVGIGLAVGKPVGILVFSWLAVKLFLKELPEGLTWGGILGAGCLAGIGFTMAMFIASLALEAELLDFAKVGVLGGSALSAVIGSILLVLLLPKPRPSAKGQPLI